MGSGRAAQRQPALNGRWLQSSFLAAVLAASMTGAPAQAFDLGRLTTLSNLGEPLKLEYEVLELDAADVDSLKIALGSAQSYASRGLVFDPVLEGLRLGLVKSANDRWVIRIEGQRPTAEPFVDLLLDISWASGATTRSVSVLLAPAVQTPLAASSTGSSKAAAPEPSAVALITQPGDTAGELIRRARPAGVEQSQYLLALVQGNPAAFVEGNVNRLLAGARLNLPTAAQALVTPALEARQIVAAQWQEFQALRQQAAASPATLAPSARSPGAQAQGQVESARAAGAPADKLTLSKPDAQGSLQAEQTVLNERQAKDTTIRLEELKRTVQELSQLQANEETANPAAASATPAPTASPMQDIDVPPTGLIDQLADHPAVLPVAGSLFGLALAWLGWSVQRKAQAKKAARPNLDEA